MSKILIADSGATKTDWCLTEKGEIIHRFQTKGISPIFQTEEEIATEVNQQVAPQLVSFKVKKIRFYGSGCIPEKIAGVKQAIKPSFDSADIEVYSDLIAAAHALCGSKSGIACILGTGSNSCEWNGKEVTKQISPLGFILGDEGSGAHLGKLLIGDVLKNQLTTGYKEQFLEQYNLTQTEIIDRVYRQPFPSRFLASISPFVLQNIQDESIRKIATQSFAGFFERNIKQYNYHKYAVNFVGSIAWYYADIIKDIASQKGYQIGKIMQSPMEGLIEFYENE